MIRDKNIIIQPISNEAFISSMASATGILCGAGFETPAEALFMKKKLMVIPMKGQYEQQCNAAALKEMGVPVIKSLKAKHLPAIKAWLKDEEIIEVDYPDMTEEIVNKILEEHAPQHQTEGLKFGKVAYDGKGLRKVILKKIVAHF